MEIEISRPRYVRYAPASLNQHTIMHVFTRARELNSLVFSIQSFDKNARAAPIRAIW